MCVGGGKGERTFLYAYGKPPLGLSLPWKIKSQSHFPQELCSPSDPKFISNLSTTSAAKKSCLSGAEDSSARCYTHDPSQLKQTLMHTSEMLTYAVFWYPILLLLCQCCY